MRTESGLKEQAPQTDTQPDDANPRVNLDRYGILVPLLLPGNPYDDLKEIAGGMTGLVYALDEDRVVKKPQLYTSSRGGEEPEYENEHNQKTLKREI